MGKAKIKNMNKFDNVFIVPSNLIESDDITIKLLKRLNILWPNNKIPSLALVHKWLIEVDIFVSVYRNKNINGVFRWSSTNCEKDFECYDDALKAGILRVLLNDELLKEKGLLKVEKTLKVKYKGKEVHAPYGKDVYDGGMTIVDGDTDIKIKMTKSLVVGKADKLHVQYNFDPEEMEYSVDKESVTIDIPVLNLRKNKS